MWMEIEIIKMLLFHQSIFTALNVSVGILRMGKFLMEGNLSLVKA